MQMLKMRFTWMYTRTFVLVVVAGVLLCTNAREYLIGRPNWFVIPGAPDPQKDFSTQDEIPNDASSVIFDASYNMGISSFGFSHLSQCESLKFYGFSERIDIEQHTWYGLSNLKDLSIVDSDLAFLNEKSFQHLASLKTLSVTDSKISTIDPIGIWRDLTSLNELYLDFGNVKCLETNAFLGLMMLQKLSLTSNDISEIKHNAFNGLLAVNHIDLHHNSLTKIDKNMWKSLDSLTHLNLAFNQIAAVEVGTWTYLRNLMLLDLSRNVLNALHPGMFGSLQALKELKVNFNNISAVDKDAFSGLKRIQTIWLTANRLTTLWYNSFNNDDFMSTGGRPEKLTLYLYSNQFHCDDKLNWMKIGEKRGWLSVIPGSCVNFPGIDWEDITLPEPSNPHNECADGTHLCSDDSECSDTLESYNCTCKSGFTGDGYTCSIIKECDAECSEYAYCDKVMETFQCKCRHGFTGDGSTCSNLNECSKPQNPCSEFAKCTDTLGSFYCFCRLGFEGNGFACNTFVSCPSGSYLENGINCTLCPLNSYSSRDNNVLSNCIQCPPNYVTGAVGSTSVSQCFLPTSCSPGHFTNETSGECSQCENSTYQPRASQTSCRVCPGNKLETGGPGAVLISNCVIKQTKQVLFKLRLLTDGYDNLLNDQTSDVFKTQSNAVRNTLVTALNGTRYFLDVYVESFSLGSILADMAATLINHPDAESVFFASLDSLLDSLFPGGAFLQGNPDIEVFSVTDLEPSFGPQSGGTLVTLHGMNLQLHGVFNVEIETIRCPLVFFEDDKVVCETAALSNEEILNVPQAVKVSWSNTEISDENTRYNFTYRADPEIKNIEPKLTIVGGGIHITVTGENMDSVAEPIMVVVVVNLLTGDPSIFYQACENKSSTEFVCPTPDLSDVVTDDNYMKQVESGYCEIPIKYHDVHDTYQRSTGTSKDDIKVNVQFLMDGVNNGKDQEKIFDIRVQSNPVFEKQEMQSYIPHSPCNDYYIEIKGQNFLQGLTPDVYTVKVGNEACTELSVTNNLITCRPPKSRPDTHSEVQVIIGTGCFTHYAFTLDYGGSFDCKPVPYITVASLFIVLLLVVVIAVFLKHRRHRLLNNRSKKRGPSRFHITPPIPLRGTPIRSWYPLMPYPTYPSYLDLIQSASLGHEAYLYPYPVNNDYRPHAYLKHSSSNAKAMDKPPLSQQQVQPQKQRQQQQEQRPRPLVPHPYDNAYTKR